MEIRTQVGQKQLTIKTTIQMDKIADVYTWEAVYNDGTSLWECNPKGQVINKYSDIERGNVKEFRLYKSDELLGLSDPKGCIETITLDNELGKFDTAGLSAVERNRLSPADMKTLKPAFSIEIKEGRRLIWRKRRHQRLLELTPFLTIYMIGWQETIEGRNVQSILYIYPDGTNELSERKTNGELDVVLFDFEE